MIKKAIVGLPVLASLVLLSACGGAPKSDAPQKQGASQGDDQRLANTPTDPHAPSSNSAPLNAAGSPDQALPQREMQPLQPGLPQQKQPRPTTPSNAVAAGNPGTTPLLFNQPFKLGDLEYKFDACKGKGFVGLEANPVLKPTNGNMYFVVRYVVTNNGAGPVAVPNNAAIHLMNSSTKQVSDIDQAATNANIQAGTATGLPDQLSLDPGVPNVQTLVFEVPATASAETLDILVTDPKDPTHLFQLVKLGN